VFVCRLLHGQNTCICEEANKENQDVWCSSKCIQMMQSTNKRSTEMGHAVGVKPLTAPAWLSMLGNFLCRYLKTESKFLSDRNAGLLSVFVSIFKSKEK
jgi:hypothetical protein